MNTIVETYRTWLLLRHLRAGIHRSPDGLKLLQDKLLRAAVAHAYENIPFYQYFWSTQGFDACKLAGVQDLEHMPIMTRRMARKAALQGQLLPRGVIKGECTYLDTSGSSGPPVRIWRQPLEQRIWRSVGLRMLLEHGIRWHHTAAQFQRRPGPLHPLQRLGIARKTWISTESPRERQMEQFLESEADVMVGTPTVLRRIANDIKAAGKKPKTPRVVFALGELIDAETQRVVKQVLGEDPVGVYGQTEAGFIAWQCERHDAFHVNADTLLVEVLRNGRPVGPGELGTIVITDLLSRTMPFLRYETGDLAISAHATCPCGRGLPVLGSIEGRAKGSVVLKDGRILTTRAIVNHMAKVLRLGEYRLHQEAIDRIRVELAPGDSDNREFSEIAPSEQEFDAVLSQHLQQLFGNVEISVKRVNHWPEDDNAKTQTVTSAVRVKV